MRCPKCGYISFDHLENCLKCNKEIKKSADALHGTVFNTAAPNFLKFNTTVDEKENDFEQEFSEEEMDLDSLDPDLDILLDNDTDIKLDDGLDAFSGLGGDDDDFEISLGDDETGDVGTGDDEISIDFNQFEDVEIEDTPEEESIFTMDVPDELSDLSDLEPEIASISETELEPEPEPEQTEEPDLDLSMDDDFDFDLNIEGLEDELQLSSTTDNATAEASETAVLSLEDEDLAENSEKEIDPNDMDADLDFDLDLGGLTLDK